MLEFLNLFAEFRATSWDAWRQILARLTPATREFWAICGRGAGKSRVAAVLACYYATQKVYQTVPGERIYVGVIAPDRKQATNTLNYIRGLLQSVPDLAALIENETSESIDLVNGVTLEVISATVAAPRGRSYALVILEEAAQLRDELSANPDIELLRAVEPALARVPGSLLCVITSPYARKGIVWEAWRRNHEQPSDDVLLVQAPTLDLNPGFNTKSIENLYRRDPARAAAEYGAQFRTDVETFVALEVLEHNVVPGRYELPAVPSVRYAAFVDPSGGQQDSFTLAIAHREDDLVVLDVVRERKPPFSPEEVVREYAGLIKRYGQAKVVGDRYGGEFPRELFRKQGVQYELSAKPKVDLYRDMLSRLNSGGIELLDHPKLIAQLARLERRVGRAGRDSIDHPKGEHDDLANVVAGVCEATPLSTNRRHECTWGDPPAPPADAIREIRPGVFVLSEPRGYRGRPLAEIAEAMALKRMFSKVDE